MGEGDKKIREENKLNKVFCYKNSPLHTVLFISCGMSNNCQTITQYNFTIITSLTWCDGMTHGPIQTDIHVEIVEWRLLWGCQWLMPAVHLNKPNLKCAFHNNFGWMWYRFSGFVGIHYHGIFFMQKYTGHVQLSSTFYLAYKSPITWTEDLEFM